jgi:hypothetical protein
MNTDITIGIVTFKERKSLVQDLVYKLRKTFPESVDIVLAINGNNEELMDENYRQEMLDLAKSYKNIYPIFCPEFKSLSKLWNTLIIFSKTEYNLILCDDTEIANPNIYNDIMSVINNNGYDFFTINYEFSHFVCTKKCVHGIGYFDERLSAFGYEDMDMHYRYIRKNNKNIQNIFINGIYNKATYHLKNDKIETFVHNKPKFCDEVVKLMYVNDPNGIVHPMDKTPITKVWKDIQQYPYEMFARNNRHNVAKFEKVVLDE